MFLKRDNLLRFKSLSLVTKLMMFYSLSTIGLITAIGFFLYPTFVKVMEKMNGTEASYITAECYEKIIITLLLSSLVAIIVGHIVARNGLNRMREFEDKMEKISADTLHERIDLDEWPKELKVLGKKFNSMLDRIHVSFNQLSDFSSDIAHEIRTPIHNLRGMTEVALSKENYSDEYRCMLEKQLDEYNHLSKLIENLLFLARSDHGQLVLKRESIDVQLEISKIVEYYQAIADEKNIDVVCIGQARLGVDLLLFKRIISNVLSNALRYTSSNGAIRIAVESNAQSVSVLVSDNGVGIPSECLLRIFDRFYRVDSSRTLSSGGLGLGLTIVKSIVELHQGRVTIESQVDVGTSVLIVLPVGV